MLKKSVNDLLFLAHKFLAFFKAIGLALDVDRRAVMQDTVQDRGGNGYIGKDLIPLGKGLVGSKDCRGLLIAPGDELEEQVRALNVHGKIADLIDDGHPVLGQHLELIRQAVLKMSLFQLLNQLVAVDIVGGKPVLRSHKAEGGS